MKFFFLLFIPLYLQAAVELKFEEDLSAFTGTDVKEEVFFRTRIKLLKEELKKIEPSLDPWSTLELKLADAQKLNPNLKRDDFYRLFRFFKKFQVKNFSAHAEKANVWEIEATVEIDSMGLKHWAQSFVQNKTGKRLVLIYQPEYRNMDFNQLQVPQKDFEQPFLDLWMSHLREFDLSSIAEVELCLDECLVEYHVWNHNKGNISFKDALLIEIKFTITANTIKALIPQNKLAVEGGVLLIDGLHHKIHFHRDLLQESKTHALKSQRDLNSAYATQIYRFPLGLLQEIKKALLSLNDLKKWKLKIIGAKSLSEVLKVKDWLSLKHLNKGGQASLESFSQAKSVLQLIEIGEEKNIQDRISSLKELESLLGRKCLVTNESDEFILTCDP